MRFAWAKRPFSENSKKWSKYQPKNLTLLLKVFGLLSWKIGPFGPILRVLKHFYQKYCFYLIFSWKLTYIIYVVLTIDDDEYIKNIKKIWCFGHFFGQSFKDKQRSANSSIKENKSKYLKIHLDKEI